MDTMATMFAMQSINSKRMTPYRRSYHYMAGLGLYENDGFSFTMGMLSGGYSWPDSMYLDTNVRNASRVALWASLLGYRLPATIHDLMVNRRLRNTAIWSRMMTRFSREHYEGGRAALYSQDSTIYQDAPYDRTPQVYLLAPRFVNASGGRYMRYAITGDTSKEFASAFTVPFAEFDYKDPASYAKTMQNMADAVSQELIHGNPVPKDSDFLSRPQTILPHGHVPNWSRAESVDKERANFLQYLPAMFGNPARFWMAENDATFKGFSYGYQYYGSNQWDTMNEMFGETGTDRHLRYPMYYPKDETDAKYNWEQYRYHESGQYEFAPDNNQHARARFKFYDLRNTPIKGDPQGRTWGILLVMARVSKDSNDTKYRSYARGFWEAVPASRFTLVADLKKYVLANNPSDNFPNKTSDGRHYRYTLTSGETVEMESLLGYDDNDGCKRNPIIRIWAAGKNWRKDKEDNRNLYLYDACDTSKNGQPAALMMAEELDEKFAYTSAINGSRIYLVNAAGGVMLVKNPYLGDQKFVTNSADYRQPTCSESMAARRPLNLCAELP
jgi:hypothetical protein